MNPDNRLVDPYVLMAAVLPTITWVLCVDRYALAV